MVGLALLTVLSLLWMPLRVHGRGRFGRKASTTLRSAYAIVLGLGGWFLGALIVITTMPGVPLDDELLAALSVGGPIGLGIYWAWLHRDWSGATKTAGFVAAMAGALVGALLGFHATPDLLPSPTAIGEATASANLMLIVLDMTWQRSIGTASQLTPMSSQPRERRRRLTSGNVRENVTRPSPRIGRSAGFCRGAGARANQRAPLE